MFGAPLHPIEGESTRRFNARIEAAVTMLADEATTDWWTARRRAADGTSPALAGPEYTGWRRQWDLTDAPPPGHRRLAQAPHPPLARPRLTRRDLAGSVNCSQMAARSGRSDQRVPESGRSAAGAAVVVVATALAQSAGGGRLIERPV